MEPTVVLNPPKDSALYKNEVFGPIMKISTYTNYDDVIREIQQREKPLVTYYFGSAVFGAENLHKLKTMTSSGQFVVNDVGIQIMNPHIPFGGVGRSGQGAFKGKIGFDSFSHKKSCLIKIALPPAIPVLGHLGINPFTPLSKLIVEMVTHRFVPDQWIISFGIKLALVILIYLVYSFELLF
jgi:hypothetical protein